MDDVLTTPITIARCLTTSSSGARGRAVRSLVSWLSSQHNDDVSNDDLTRIWHGIFYCVWHADKPSSELRIADRVAGLIGVLPLPLACRYIEKFVVTVRQEWAGIDSNRIHKFYLLIRRFMCHLFLRAKKNSLDIESSVRIIRIMWERSFFDLNNSLTDDFGYHIIEVFLDELMGVLPITVEVFELMLEPCLLVLQRSTDKILGNEVRKNVFGRLLENGRMMLSSEMVGEQVDAGTEVAKLGKMCLVSGLAKKFFESASALETLQFNRKVLFCLHEEFLELENDLVKSGVKISLQFEENGGSKDVSGKEVSGNDKLVEVGVNVGVSSPSEVNVVIFLSAVNSVHSRTTDQYIGKNRDLSFECDSSDLLKRFETSAAETGCMTNESSNTMITTSVAGLPVKKQKRPNSSDGKLSNKSRIKRVSTSNGSDEESIKKVRFSMKSNLTWRPHNPLPPESLRLPPSAAPRGSALKKGVPPGPITESPISVKKRKAKRNAVKKSKKGLKSASS